MGSRACFSSCQLPQRRAQAWELWRAGSVAAPTMGSSQIAPMSPALEADSLPLSHQGSPIFLSSLAQDSQGALIFLQNIWNQSSKFLQVAGQTLSLKAKQAEQRTLLASFLLSPPATSASPLPPTTPRALCTHAPPRFCPTLWFLRFSWWCSFFHHGWPPGLISCGGYRKLELCRNWKLFTLVT